MRDRFSKFMYGRNGSDELTRFLVYFSLALLIINMFTRSSVLMMFIYLILGYSIFRMLSRNTAARAVENQKFLNWWQKVKNRFRGQGARMKELKNYHIYRCPNCGQKIRIPRGRGRIEITCPKCKTQFQKNS